MSDNPALDLILRGRRAVPIALLAGLVSYWTLDEASGTRNDSHGTNHLTDNNTVTQAVGKVGNAGQFTAANSEWLSRADNASLSTGDIDFTVACWVYLDSSGNATAMAKWATGGADREYVLFYNNNDHVPNARFSFGVSPNGSSSVFLDATTFGAPSTGTWYFLAAWHDSAANTINIQVNDGPVDSMAHSTGVFDGAAPFLVGSLNATGLYLWSGRIDEAGFWKRVLTAAERTALYNAGAGRTHPFVGT